MLIFDLETDGLLDEVSVIHCIHIYDTETSRYERYNDQNYKADGGIFEGVARLAGGKTLLAHNGIGYDYIVLDMLYPNWDVRKVARLDSMILARLLWPDMREGDFAARARGYWKVGGKSSQVPEKFGGIIGSHSLKAWGYRFGEHKGDFNPKDYTNPETGEPHTWNSIGWCEDMDDYCRQDVAVTKALWELIESKEPSPVSVEMEHHFATIISRQERHGFFFSLKAADKLHQILMERKAELEDILKEFFPPWEKTTYDTFTPKRDNKTKGYKKGVSIRRSKTKEIVFNPASRDHIADRLQQLYGWKPTDTTNAGKPKVDETTLKGLDYEPVPYLREYLTIDKRLGQLAEGRQAWLKAVKSDSRIHGRVNTNGAVTGRCTHSSPNVAQVPAVRAAFGEQCRSLFCVPPGFKLVGADASGLELRCLAHFMARWDEGEYTREILAGDIHTKNQNAAGLDTRDQAKTFIYALCYGAGDAKIGQIVGKGAKAGKELKKKFFRELPALGRLITLVQRKAEVNKRLIGLDGRFLHVRSGHAALNTLLQSAGAVIMKKYLCILDDALQAKGLVPGVDYEHVANVHDETQIECREEHAELVAATCEESFPKSAEFFDFRCPIEGEAKVGNNWADTH